MTAAPLIAGRLYRVTGHGFQLEIIASHPCAALRIAVDQLLKRQPR